MITSQSNRVITAVANRRQAIMKRLRKLACREALCYLPVCLRSKLPVLFCYLGDNIQRDAAQRNRAALSVALGGGPATRQEIFNNDKDISDSVMKKSDQPKEKEKANSEDNI